ncbi:hypothetical protein [Priestia megaterium]
MFTHDRNEDTEPYTKDDSYKNLDRVNLWISNCDSKASFVLAFLGIFIGVFFTSDFIYDNLKALGNTFLKFEFSDFTGFISLISLISLLIFIVKFIQAGKYTLGALTASIDPDEYSSMGVKVDSNLHFLSIDKKGFNTHFQEVQNLNDEKDLIRDIESQVAINSRIANRKFSNYKNGIVYSKQSLLYFVVFLLLSSLIR